MLRDIPRVYGLLLFFIILLVGLTTWYTTTFNRDTVMLGLNELVLTTAVNEVDHSSRVYEGVLFLADTFEAATMTKLEERYADGTTVQFDYKFDDSSNTITLLGLSASDVVPVSSVVYTIGGAAPTTTDSNKYRGLPIEAVRVKVKEPSDEVTDWTNVSTITVDALSR